MGDRSKIDWCDSTWNPVSGCAHSTVGCDSCYACTMANRMGGKGQHFEGLAEGGRWTGKVNFYPHMLLKPWKWFKPRQIFVCSMGDLFYEGVSVEQIDRVFGVIAACSANEVRGHNFLILTKRPERLREYFGQHRVVNRWMDCAFDLIKDEESFLFRDVKFEFPLNNVWIGTSTENQEHFDKRVPEIMKTPAVKKFVSIEPMLGPIRIFHGVDWVIAGGESSPSARPCHPEWVRGLRDQCLALRIPFMFKQWGEWKPVSWYSQATHAVRLDGYTVKLDHAPLSISRSTKAPSGWQGIARVGKAKAGRELDGEVHDGYP